MVISLSANIFSVTSFPLVSVVLNSGNFSFFSSVDVTFSSFIADEDLLSVTSDDEAEELFAKDEASLLPASLATLLSSLGAEVLPTALEQAVTAKDAVNISPNNFLFIKPPI